MFAGQIFFTNPAPGIVDCFESNILFLQVQIVEAILNQPEGFIAATRQLVKLLKYTGKNNVTKNIGT